MSQSSVDHCEEERAVLLICLANYLPFIVRLCLPLGAGLLLWVPCTQEGGREREEGLAGELDVTSVFSACSPIDWNPVTWPTELQGRLGNRVYLLS